MKVIILAGGFATRLWPITEKYPKPLLPIAGEPIINFLVKDLPLDCNIIVSTNSFFADTFQNWKKKFFPKKKIKIFVENSESESEKIGALAAVALAIKKFNIKDNLLVLAGDNFCQFSLKDFLASCDKNPNLAAFDIGEKKLAKKFGVVIPGEKNFIKNFKEKPENPTSTLISTGFLFFPQNLLTEILEFSKKHSDNLGGIFEYFLQKNIPVQFFKFSEKWFDIGNFSDFLAANKFKLNGKTKNFGKKLSKKNTFLGGNFLGENCQLSETILENAIIDSSSILENCTIRNSFIGKNCHLRGVDLQFVALRENSIILE